MRTPLSLARLSAGLVALLAFALAVRAAAEPTEARSTTSPLDVDIAPAVPLEADPDMPDPEPPPDGLLRITGRPGAGITFATVGERFSMSLRGRARLEHGSSFQGDLPARHALVVRTVRLALQGNTFSPRLRYNVQLAFGPREFDTASPSPILDAWVEYAVHPRLNVRAGQYFVPFDRARAIRSYALQLVDRQQPVRELSLDRDIGVMVYSRDLLESGGHLGYQLGVFSGEGRNVGSPTTSGFLFAGRLSWRPFGDFDSNADGDLERRDRPAMAVSVGAGWNRGSTRYRSTNGPRFEFAEFDQLHLALDGVIKWRGFSLMGEALVRTSDVPWVERVTDEGVTEREWAREGWGYLVQAGQMLSERVEVSARWDELYAFDETDPDFAQLAEQLGREVGAGVSFYANGHRLKLQADWGVRFGRERSDEQTLEPAHVVRAALDVSF